MKKLLKTAGGFAVGILNGFFGSGGGIFAVFLLEKDGTEVKKAHATSVAVTFFLSLISAAFYLSKGSVDISDVLPLIPFGLAGAALGCYLMKKIPDALLRGVFGVLLSLSAVRLFFI